MIYKYKKDILKNMKNFKQALMEQNCPNINIFKAHRKNIE
jgi:hypothetical protein